jgi:ketosteroid isomerase-like protein
MRTQAEIVRKPLKVREQSRRTLDQRLALRFPRLAAANGRLIAKLPPRSRIRQAVIWRVVRLGMEAFNRRDLDAAVGPGSPDFETYPPHEFVEAGFFEPCYRGPAGFLSYMSAWDEAFADLRVEPAELLDLGDRIVLLAELPTRGQGSGVPFTGKLAQVSEMKDGMVIRVHAYLDHAEALEAVGLQE